MAVFGAEDRESGASYGCAVDETDSSPPTCTSFGGGRATSDADADGIHTETPPEVLVTRVTGAGDTFMAAHIAAESRGEGRAQALALALQAAATYVSGGHEA